MVFSIPAAASDFLVGGEKAAVSNTNGYGLNIRSAPTTSSDVHFVASEGTVMDIVSGPEEADGLSWYGVHVDGYEAWVMAQYLDGVASQAGDEVKVVKTNGHGLRLRTEPGAHGDTKTVIPEGTVLGVLGDEQTDDSGTTWAHVKYAGTEGYAHRSYLAVVSIAGQTSDEASAGDPVNEDPGNSDAPVEAEDPPQSSEPEPGNDAGQDDTTNDEPDQVQEPEPVDEPAEVPADTNGIVVGGNVEVYNTGGYGLNVRHGVGFGQSVVTVAAEGHVMQVLGGPEADRDGANWWNVDYRGHNGWVHGAYVRATNAEPTDAGSGSGQSSSGDDDSSPPPSTSPVGQQIVNQAMRFLGYPYVWGGTTPAGFDCSGFLYYVVNQVAGNNYPRSLEAQVNRGTYVPSDQLQPGDLVFQQNTYQWGLSHAGIYIGNGQFIHASTPGSGVIISNLWDSYWGQRYYTARRIQ
jgi:cell wall-associated NlpC family hydrolase